LGPRPNLPPRSPSPPGFCRLPQAGARTGAWRPCRRRRHLAACLEALSPLLDAPGDAQLAPDPFSPSTASSPTSVRPPHEETAEPRNPSRPWRRSDVASEQTSRAHLVQKTRNRRLPRSPLQSKTKSTPGDASFTEDSPDPQDAVVEFAGHRASPATPPPQKDSG